METRVPTVLGSSVRIPPVIRQRAVLLLILVVHVAASDSQQLLKTFSCTNARFTGYNSHRTLHIPAASWDAAENSDSAITWANRLCCVFTWAIRDADATYPYMITYDGGKINYAGLTTFSQAGEASYNAICAMSMGSQDCKQPCNCATVALFVEAFFICHILTTVS